MSYSVTITNVTGANNSSGTITIGVSGTSTGTSYVKVEMQCDPESYSGMAVVAATPNGDWSCIVEADDCRCNSFMFIRAFCVDALGNILSYDSSTYEAHVPCNDDQSCCLVVSLDAKILHCDQGMREVEFFIGGNAVSSGCPPYNFYLNYGDGQVSPTYVVTATGPFSFQDTHLYNAATAGSFVAMLYDAAHPQCPPVTVDVQFQACAACLPIAFKIEEATCNPDGTRDVVYTATFQGSYSTEPISAQIAGPCGSVSGTGMGSLTLSGNCALGASSYSVTAFYNDCPAQTFPFTVDSCCPIVAFEQAVEGCMFCDDAGGRTVVVKATVTPPPGVNTTATLSDSNGNILDTGFGNAPFPMTGIQTFSEGSQTVQVSFAAPSPCPPQSFTFCVPGCETLFCWLLRSGVVVALSVYLSMSLFILFVYLAGQQFIFTDPLTDRYLDFGAVTAALAPYQIPVALIVTGVLIFWALCLRLWGYHIGSCCGSACLWLIVAWQTCFIVAATLLYYLSCNFIWHLIGAIILVVIGILFFLWWRRTCCPGRCDALCNLSMAALLATSDVFAIFSGTYHLLFPHKPTFDAACFVSGPSAFYLGPVVWLQVLYYLTMGFRIALLIAAVYVVALAIRCVSRRLP